MKKTGIIFFVLLTLALIVVDNINDPRKRKVPVIPDTSDFLATVYQLELDKQSKFVVVRPENYQSPFFTPQARVGSREPDAVRMGREELLQSMRTKFLVTP